MAIVNHATLDAGDANAATQQILSVYDATDGFVWACECDQYERLHMHPNDRCRPGFWADVRSLLVLETESDEGE